MKKLLLVVLTLTLILSFTSCFGNTQKQSATPSSTPASDTSYADVQAKGEIVIGLDDTFAPMGFRDEAGELIGFDVDMAKAVCEELGIKAKFQPIDWTTKEMQLDTKKVDLLWNGLSITPARQEIMLLTKPYLNNKIVIMTKKDSSIQKIQDLVGKKIGIQGGSSALDVVKANDVYSKISSDLTEYVGYDEALMDLKIGRTEAVIIDDVMGKYKNAKMDSIFAFATEDFGPDEYGVGMRKTDKQLFDKLSEAIEKVKANGKATEISKKWFKEDIIVK